MDPRLRDLERRWQASESFADGHAYARALLRARPEPLDLLAEVKACLPETGGLIDEPFLRPVKFQAEFKDRHRVPVELPGDLHFVRVSQHVWENSLIDFLFAVLDGVPYLLQPRGFERAPLDRIPAVLWPSLDEVGAEALEAWRTFVSNTFLIQQRPGGAVRGVLELDLAPLLLPSLQRLAQARDSRGLAPWLGMLGQLYGYNGSLRPESYQVFPAGALPPELAVHAVGDLPAFETKYGEHTARAYLYGTWEGVEELVYYVLTVGAVRWSFLQVGEGYHNYENALPQLS